MCPEKANVVIFDDDPIVQDLFARELTRNNHQLVGAATSKAGALALIEQLAKEKTLVDVAIIDGDLKSPESTREEQKAGHDGELIAEALSKTLPATTRVGCRDGEQFSGVDVFINKSQWKEKLIPTVVSAPSAQQTTR